MQTHIPEPDLDFAALEAPPSRKVARYRALYLVTSLGVRANDVLREFLKHSLPTEGSGTIPDPSAYRAAVKELLCVMLWLCLVERELFDPPAWIKQFMLDCLNLSDEMYEVPTSKEVLDTYRFDAGKALACDAVSLNLTFKLNAGSHASDAVLFISSRVKDLEGERRAIFADAVSKPIQALEEQVSELLRSE